MRTVLIVKFPYSLVEGDHHILLTTDEEGANEATINVQIKSRKDEGSELHFTGIDITHPRISLPVKGVLRWDGDFQVGTLTYSD